MVICYYSQYHKMEHTSFQLCLLFHLLFVTYTQSCGFYLLVISLVYPLLSILIFYHKCTSKMASLLGRRYLFNELIMFSIMYVISYMQFLTPHETYICLISFTKYICYQQLFRHCGHRCEQNSIHTCKGFIC